MDKKLRKASGILKAFLLKAGAKGMDAAEARILVEKEVGAYADNQWGPVVFSAGGAHGMALATTCENSAPSRKRKRRHELPQPRQAVCNSKVTCK